MNFNTAIKVTLVIEMKIELARTFTVSIPQELNYILERSEEAAKKIEAKKGIQREKQMRKQMRIHWRYRG